MGLDIEASLLQTLVLLGAAMLCGPTGTSQSSIASCRGGNEQNEALTEAGQQDPKLL